MNLFPFCWHFHNRFIRLKGFKIYGLAYNILDIITPIGFLDVWSECPLANAPMFDWTCVGIRIVVAFIHIWTPVWLSGYFINVRVVFISEILYLPSQKFLILNGIQCYRYSHRQCYEILTPPLTLLRSMQMWCDPASPTVF